MKLYTYLKNHIEEEITVTDEVFDCENYWCFSDSNDLFEKSLMNIAKKLDVVEVLENGTVVCNISKLIKKKFENIKKEKLFFEIEDEFDVMESIDEIISGYVSDRWFWEFSQCLCLR